MATFALGVEYDGSAFHGFQSQADVATVQDALEDALSRVADRPVSITAAGRTDAGVHATQQVVSFETDAVRDVDAWRRGANALTDRTLTVTWCREAPEGFSARFDATARRYVYVFLEARSAPAIGRSHATWSRDRLDDEAMHFAAQSLVGEHDFSAFRAAGCQSRSPVRRIHDIAVDRRGDRVAIDVTANAFLLHMVRNVAGALRWVGIGREDRHFLADLLAAGDRTLAPPTAPPEGLYLVQVICPALGWDVPCRRPLIW